MNQTISGGVGCLINNIPLGFACKSCYSLLPLCSVLSAGVGVDRLYHYLFAITWQWETESWLRSETKVWTSTQVKSEGKRKTGLRQGQRQEPSEAGQIKQEGEVEGWAEWKLRVYQRWEWHARQPGGSGKAVHGSARLFATQLSCQELHYVSGLSWGKRMYLYGQQIEVFLLSLFCFIGMDFHIN